MLCKFLTRFRNYVELLLKSLTSRPSVSALEDHKPDLRTFLKGGILVRFWALQFQLKS